MLVESYINIMLGSASSSFPSSPRETLIDELFPAPLLIHHICDPNQIHLPTIPVGTLQTNPRQMWRY